MTETTSVAGFYLIEFWLPRSAACVEACVDAGGAAGNTDGRILCLHGLDALG